MDYLKVQLGSVPNCIILQFCYLLLGEAGCFGYSVNGGWGVFFKIY